MTASKEILELIERFDNNREAYRSGTYNETQLRREFVDPFFGILGWDVNNEKGYAEAYKDVIHEDSIKVGGVTKAPDYCFRIGGTRKFFVETKKPSVNLKDDISPAFQLRRYAWSAKLPLSILTDFEEFAVYDCRAKPDKADKASTARILYLTCNEYAQRWDEIAPIFSRDAILKGSFDRYAESSKGKKGTAEVDDVFLKEIESWRDMLARNLALRNTDLSQRDLNFAVQRTIDRIIFLRICEDRGIEQYGRLMSLQNGDRMYKRLCELFYRADERYNSGLFHFQKEKSRAEPPDTLTIGLIIDDKPLKDIIKNLYYPDSPYEFSVLSADILGQVYEQFLGKVIRLTEGHRAVVEEKPEVRKAGGVYYTPTYIVDYIVKNTVGQLVNSEVQNRSTDPSRLSSSQASIYSGCSVVHGELVEPSRRSKKPKIKDITPKEISKIRILDPACGSGSFLLGAYQYLLDWHRDWYIANDPEKWATGRSPALYQSGKSEVQNLSSTQVGDQNSQIRNWRLTTAERRRILLNNIYGVDIDPQAVEVTKLSLLLKVLEGESEQTIVKQLKMFHERALPDLGNNIKCGNSLIGPDFYHGKQMNLFDGDERYRINVFDWEIEFPEIMKSGGFDAVIGNPPYISVESTIKDVTEFYLKTFKSAYGRANSFSLFLEKSLMLANKNGHIGLIVSNRVLTNTQLTPLRKLLLENSTIERILTFKKAVFKAAVDTIVITFQKISPAKEHLIEIWFDIKDLAREDFRVNKVHQTTFIESPSYVFNVKQQGGFKNIVQKIRKTSVYLEQLCDIKDGIILGGIKDLFLSNTRMDSRYEKWLEGNEVSRYYIGWMGRYICYDSTLIEEELKRKYDKAKRNATTSSDFEKLSRSGIWLRKPEIFRQEKILTRQNAKRIIGVFDEMQYFVKNSLHCILLKDKAYNLKYILGLINSRLMDFYFQDQIGSTGEIFSQLKIAYIEKLPIHPVNFSDPVDKARHDRMVELVNQMLELHKQLASAKTNHDKTVIQRQIDATDQQIDQLVYELYRLTKEEIKIVEERL
ncbi:MAG TPA: Eco57I restriction-modification methylase domain-containing protein [Candidatus Wujingus californicus]|uniref:Eco57I restriction-modification methylase domain-containing protein n=1 Tax=Candidatus Wujingus californicus TaxID=3367618 RepID=UPI001E160A55|nr:N-6 DNA methylase [Planctomycetota bacterium]MDO8094915.1 TaqI-like C-terminal specificity domain-containing protein [Candidatus Brocadiales bacterium]